MMRKRLSFSEEVDTPAGTDPGREHGSLGRGGCGSIGGRLPASGLAR